MRLLLLYWEDDEELATALSAPLRDDRELIVEFVCLGAPDLPLETYLRHHHAKDRDCVILLWTEGFAMACAAHHGKADFPRDVPIGVLTFEDDFLHGEITSPRLEGYPKLGGREIAIGRLPRGWRAGPAPSEVKAEVARLAEQANLLTLSQEAPDFSEERLRRKDVVKVFSRYMDPKVVSTLDIEWLPETLADAIAARGRTAAVLASERASARASNPVADGAPAPKSGPFLDSAVKVALAAAGAMVLLGFGLEALGVKVFQLFNMVPPAGPEPGGPEGTGREERHPADCSVFAPPRLPAGQTMLIQVFLHPPELQDRAERAARLADEGARPRGFTSLSVDLAEGERVGFALRAPGLEVSDDGVGELRWRNRVTGLQFLVSAPEDCEAGLRQATLVFSTEGVPRGHIHFGIEVTPAGSETAEAAPRGDAAKRYSKAFISYASKDRNAVLERVQMLGPFGIEVFQDVLSLDPGERWAQALYKNIDDCDLFFLFWSRHARDSQWVIKEALYADDRRNRSPEDEPDIYPVLLEGPPPVPPPEALAHLHFDDRLRYFMGD